MHRDIKPSNILVNSRGCIKLCDFGVSSELENSIANTFVGTGTYMAPERIQGSAYTVKSDVWSFGLTLMELAIGKFPFTSEVMSDDEDGMEGAGPQGILDLLQQIVGEPSPKLPKSDAFPTILESMLDRCLMKDPDQRPTPQDLYVSFQTYPRLVNSLISNRNTIPFFKLLETLTLTSKPGQAASWSGGVQECSLTTYGTKRLPRPPQASRLLLLQGIFPLHCSLLILRRLQNRRRDLGQ